MNPSLLRPRSLGTLLPLLVAHLFLLTGAVPAQWERVLVRPLKGEPFVAAFSGLDADGNLSFRTGSGEVIQRPDSLVSVIAEEGDLIRGTNVLRFDFANGDVFYGVVEGGNYDELKLASAATGPFTVFVDPLKQIAAQLSDPRPLPEMEEADTDLLFLRRSAGVDRIPGELKRFDRSGIVFDPDGAGERLFRFGEDAVLALRLSEPTMPKELAGVHCRVRLRDGGLLTGVLAAGKGRDPLFKIAWGPEVTLSLAHVRSIEFQSKAFIALGDLKATSVQETPYLPGGLLRGLHRHQGVGRDNPLRIGNETYFSGISAAARTEIHYDLPASCSRLTALVGVDPGTANRGVPGSVRIKILAGEHAVYESPLLVSGQAATPINVDLKGARHLKILVDFGSSGPTGAFAVIADALLIR
jgi:hypothetical protein